MLFGFFWKMRVCPIEVLLLNDQTITLAFVDRSTVKWLLTALYASPIAKFRT